MKLNSSSIRKWCRNIHRELSYFFTGVLLIYLISGIVMNHRDTINPNYTVERKEYKVEQAIPEKAEIDKDFVIGLLKPLGEEKNYTKHYFPQPGEMKVFLKGGSNLTLNIENGSAVYESVKRKHVISAMTRLHYNPGKWWTTFSDIFAIGMIIVVVTGVVMLKGNKGLWGRGGIELLAGIAIPLLFIFFF